MIGRNVSHYEVLARIGSGGMGDVYRARDTRLDRTVVLKFLPPARAEDAAARERFLREARAASRLASAFSSSQAGMGESSSMTARSVFSPARAKGWPLDESLPADCRACASRG